MMRNQSDLQSCKRQRITSYSVEEVNLESEEGSPALVQARRVQLILGTQFPSFIKLLCKSYVEGNTPQLDVPLAFCRLYLPKDEVITLEDVNGEKFELSFLSKTRTFSAGWKFFVDYQRLRERDVVIFHLVEPTKFKVYIIRADYQIEANSSSVEQNGQGFLESLGISHPFQELRTISDFESRRVKQVSAINIKFERKQNAPVMPEANCIKMTKSLSFTISILKSAQGLFMPGPFCNLHLPKVETMMILENENKDQFEVKYMPICKFLSTGWSNFSNAHNLNNGDVLLFHLVDPKKFKVYITRVEDQQVNVNPIHKQ